MSATESPSKKRKIIDLPEDVFRSLSVMAAAEGKNLKSFIESVLVNEARMLNEESVYRELLKNPETQEIVSPKEKEEFESWLGV